MNNRPIVVPGILTGVIALSALTLFANLPKDDAAAASVGSADAAGCAAWVDVEKSGFSEDMAALEKAVAAGGDFNAAASTASRAAQVAVQTLQSITGNEGTSPAQVQTGTTMSNELVNTFTFLTNGDTANSAKSLVRFDAAAERFNDGC